MLTARQRRHTGSLQQILAEMARPEAVARCLELWPRSNEDLKTNYLFSRQFLGIGTQVIAELVDQARCWEQRSLSQCIGSLWPDNILEPLDGENFGLAISLPI